MCHFGCIFSRAGWLFHALVLSVRKLHCMHSQRKFLISTDSAVTTTGIRAYIDLDLIFFLANERQNPSAY